MNSLQTMPPAPNPQPQQPMQGNALAQPPVAQQGAATPSPPLAPTHLQTVAALRHFDAIEHELTGLLADPDLGKADLKSKIIDGATKLVASRIITPAQAVAQLGTVPDRPFEQKQWLESHLATTVQAASAVLAHHAAGSAGQDVAQAPYNPDDHLDIMSGLHAQYRGGPSAG